MKVNSQIIYNTRELAKMLKTSEENIRYYFRSGRFKGVKIGTRWHLSHKNLSRFINAEKQKQK